MNRQLILNLLGLATRARQIVVGEEFVVKQIAKTDCLVFLASDAGDNIKKKIVDKATYYHRLVVKDFDTTELSKAIGKENRKVVLVYDKGFMKKFIEYINF